MYNTKIETVSLFESKSHVTLTSYIAATSESLPTNEKRKALLVIPGGGYHSCTDAEGEPVAHYFLAQGFNTFVLKYSTFSDGASLWKNPLIDASAAVVHIKRNAEYYHIDPDHIFAVGFSAGGHLAAALGTLWDDPEIEELLGIQKGENRPCGVILSYPVISGFEYRHENSFRRILGDRYDDMDARRAVSLEYQVSEKNVPTFLWTTRTDKDVSVMNTLLFSKALADHGIPFEMHIYPIGGHGASIGTEIVGRSIRAIKQWKADALRWMNSFRSS